MKKNLLITICILIIQNINSQSIRDYNLEVSCKSRNYIPGLSILDFKWKNPPPTAVGQRVYRKTKDAYAWGPVYENLNNNDTTFSDTIATGSHFEYRFEKDTGHDGYFVQGYIYAGHRVLPLSQRGTILLIIDSTHKDFLTNDLRTFRNDLIGDGWFTKVFWVSPSTSVSTIKTYIVSEYNANPSLVKSVCLIGDVAVPYSGDYSAFGIPPPDNHTTFGPPSHEGAWPADMYYGDMDNASWTDVSVTNNSGARVENRNNPGDGKFDQTSIPTLIELQVGRIDLSALGSFTETQQELLRRYFLKNHQYKHNQFNVRERCLIDDNFGLLNYPAPNFDEHFAGNAYRNMAPLISDTVCFNLNYLSTLNNNSYQWSFGFGAGSYTNASGVATTAQLANPAQEVRSVFTGLFGSYFGDWDNSNNFLRAPLAARGHVLNSFWVGRPHWFFHHMGLGENIGYSTLRTQNNYNTSTLNLLYPTTSYGYLQVHVALMGDPTTRTQVVEPISSLSVTQDTCNERFKLVWNAPSDTAVHQFLIFRSNHIDSLFSQIATVNVANFTDSFPLNGDNVYMVRALKLQVSGSGTYFNLSQGIFDTIAYSIPNAIAGSDTSICLNSRLTLGTVTHGNSTNTIYEWQSGGFTTDTITFAATVNESKILIVTDTLTHCIIRDTIDITILQLPVPETITALGSICNDTINWSCTANNIASHTYNWQFMGGQPSDTTGNMLISPGKVVYPSIGTYDMILTITNNSNLCQLIDTNTQIISCLGLSSPNSAEIICNSKSISIVLNDNNINNYKQIQIKGFRNNKWESFTQFNINQNQKVYIIDKKSIYTDYQIVGINNNSDKVILSECLNTDYNKEFLITPIPFYNYIYITSNIDGFLSQVNRIEVLNIYGEVLLYFKNDDTLGSIKLNLSDLTNGVYFIKLTLENQSYVYKIVK